MAFGVTLEKMKGFVNDHITPLIDVLTDSADLLKVLPFQNIPNGVDPKIPIIIGDDDIVFRDFNTQYADAEHGPDSITEKLRPFGRTLKYDRALSAQGIAQKASEIQRAYARRMALKYCDAFINGDSAESGEGLLGFDGLKARCELDDTDNDPRVIDVGTTAGAGILTEEILDELIESVSGGANIVLCNRYGRGLVKKMAQDASHKFRYDWMTIPGTNERTITRDGVPFIAMWQNHAGDEIIPTTGGTDFYAVKMGQELVHGIQGTATPEAGPGIYVGPLENIPAQPVVGQYFEWLAGLAVPHRSFIMMLTGVETTEAGT